MKQTLLFICAAFLLFSFTDNTISIKKDKVEEAKKIIDITYQYIDHSNLPHQEVLKLEEGLKTAYTILSDTTK